MSYIWNNLYYYYFPSGRRNYCFNTPPPFAWIFFRFHYPSRLLGQTSCLLQQRVISFCFRAYVRNVFQFDELSTSDPFPNFLLFFNSPGWYEWRCLCWHFGNLLPMSGMAAFYWVKQYWYFNTYVKLSIYSGENKYSTSMKFPMFCLYQEKPLNFSWSAFANSCISF